MRPLLLAISLLGALLISCPALADTPHMPPGLLPLVHAAGRKMVPHQVVRVTGKEAMAPAEVAVAIDPANPERVIASALGGFREGNKFGQNAIYFSTDGGKTWKVNLAPSAAGRMQGDDVVLFGPDGVAYHAYITFNGIRVANPRRAMNGIYVRQSKDGEKWTEPVPVVDHINSVEPFEDKPWLVADHGKDSPNRGNVYCSWTRFDVYGSKDPDRKSHIYLARSTDKGKSFWPAVRISDKPGNAIDDSGTVEGAVPSVGVKGEIYVAWSGPEGVVIDKSTDGGRTFGKDTTISEHHGGWDFPAAGLFRHNGLPVTGVDHSTGKHRGSVYVAWIDRRHGDPDVFVAHSRDGAATWSPPVRVNNDALKNGKEQLFTWMAVDPVDGSVNLVYLDRRTAKNDKDTTTSVTIARSVDGGKSFVNYYVKQPPFVMQSVGFYGDYIGVSACAGRVIAVYPHVMGRGQLAVSTAIFQFKPGTQETANATPRP